MAQWSWWSHRRFWSHKNRCHRHGRSNCLLNHRRRGKRLAFDNSNFAFGFGDFQFRHIRVGHQINQCFKFA